jgi:hypothetical protein
MELFSLLAAEIDGIFWGHRTPGFLDSVSYPYNLSKLDWQTTRSYTPEADRPASPIALVSIPFNKLRHESQWLPKVWLVASRGTEVAET